MKLREKNMIEHQPDISLSMDKSLLKELKLCVQKASPNEACGILFGEINQIPNKELKDDYIYKYTAHKFSCIPSDKSSMVAFLIENTEILHQTIVKAMSELGIAEQNRLISIFHSHPSGNMPSITDIDNMMFLNKFSNMQIKFVSKAFKNLIWLIMDGSSYEINGFIYLNSKLYQIGIEIQE
jgi:proteasome lid subunit RPN8/RPN11